METEQALLIIREALDIATAAGVFKNMEQSFRVITAYNSITLKLAPPEQKEEEK